MAKDGAESQFSVPSLTIDILVPYLTFLPLFCMHHVFFSLIRNRHELQVLEILLLATSGHFQMNREHGMLLLIQRIISDKLLKIEVANFLASICKEKIISPFFLSFYKTSRLMD